MEKQQGWAGLPQGVLGSFLVLSCVPMDLYRVGAVPDGLLALEFCRHRLHDLTEAQAAIDAALIELLVVFPVL